MFCETNSSVSEVVLYTKCPRKIYFASRNEAIPDEIEKPYIRHLLLKELGVSPSVISDYESGRRKSPGTLIVSKMYMNCCLQ